MLIKISKSLSIDIEESDNRLVLTKDKRLFSKGKYIISFTINLVLLLIFITLSIFSIDFELQNYFDPPHYSPIFLVLVIFSASCLFFQWDMNKIHKLIIDIKNQRIDYYKNYLNPHKVNEYVIDDLAAIKVKSYRGGHVSHRFKIYLIFPSKKLNIFGKLIFKHEAIFICRKILDYLNVNFIENIGSRAKYPLTNEDIFTDFFLCLYCGSKIELSNNLKYCENCGSKFINKIEIEKFKNPKLRGVSLAHPTCGQFYLIKEIRYKKRFKKRRIYLIVKCISHNLTYRIEFPYKILPDDIPLKMLRIIAGNILRCEKCNRSANLIKNKIKGKNYLLYIKCPNHGIQKRKVSSVFFPKIEEIYRNSREITNVSQLKE